jgi:hypothetical protein
MKKEEEAFLMKVMGDEAIENTQMEEDVGKIGKAYKELRRILERKWFLAVFDHALGKKHKWKKRIEKPEGCPKSKWINMFKKKVQKILLNAIDKMPENGKNVELDIECPKGPKMLRLYFAEFNVSTFDLRVQAARESVKLFQDVVEVGKIDGQPLTAPPAGLAIAMGDANASPHFLTASGLSTGSLNSVFLTRESPVRPRCTALQHFVKERFVKREKNERFVNN